MKFPRSKVLAVSLIGLCASITLTGCDIGSGIPVGPAAVQIYAGEFALGKDGIPLNFELGEALIGVVPLCEVVSASEFNTILREEVDSSVGELVHVTEVILTSIALRFPNGIPTGADTLTLLAIPAETGLSSLGAPLRIGSTDLSTVENGGVEILAETELDLLPLLESAEGDASGQCPLLLIVLDPFTAEESILIEATLNADAYGEVSLGFVGNTAVELSGAGS